MSNDILTAASPGKLAEAHGGIVGRQAVKLAAAIRAAKERAALTGMGRTQVGALEVAALEAAEAEIQGLAAVAAERARKGLEAERIAYERSEARRADEIERQAQSLSRRYGAMADSELLAEADAIISGDIRPPAELDVISGLLKAADPERHRILRETVAQRGDYAPYQLTENGRRLKQQLANYERAARTPGSVPIEVEGRWGAVGFGDLVGGDA
jgi:hypothetical protein